MSKGQPTRVGVLEWRPVGHEQGWSGTVLEGDGIVSPGALGGGQIQWDRATAQAAAWQGRVAARQGLVAAGVGAGWRHGRAWLRHSGVGRRRGPAAAGVGARCHSSMAGGVGAGCRAAASVGALAR
jgi:hypothetical protein